MLKLDSDVNDTNNLILKIVKGLNVNVKRNISHQIERYIKDLKIKEDEVMSLLK